MKSASRKLTSTPPIMISIRCQAGLLRNSYGCIGCSELLGIETLVYHTRNLAISTQWQPSQTVSGIRVLWLELEEVEPWIEEQIELLHSYAKELGEEKCPPSWSSTRMESDSINCNALIKNTSIYLL